PASLSRSGRPSRCVAGSRMESLSLHAALRIAVIGLDWLVALPVVCAEPSPHVIVYAQGASFMPASLNVALKVNALPAVAVWLAPAFTEIGRASCRERVESIEGAGGVQGARRRTEAQQCRHTA